MNNIINIYIERAIDRVNTVAENRIKQRIGPHPGLMLIHRNLVDEATDYLASADQHHHSYPFLTAHITATGHDMDTVANRIIDKENDWVRFASNLEKIRVKAIMKIRAAITEQELDELVNTFCVKLNNC